MENDIHCVVDVGGTKILLMLIDSSKQVLYREKFPTPVPSDPEKVARLITEKINGYISVNDIDSDNLCGLGVCIAAFVNGEKGHIYHAPNLHWHNVPFKEILEKYWLNDSPVHVENDANAAIVGEVFYGAARGHKNAIYITLSTGIGGGLFLNGRLFRGSEGFAGEVGHTKPYGQNRVCNCGGLDCLETWASGSAIARNASLNLLGKEGGGGDITTAGVFENADLGDRQAENIINEAVFKIGTGLANLVTLLNPSCLVIGGGVAANRPDFMDRIAMMIKKQAIEPAVKATELVISAAQLEPDSGAWGMYATINKQAVV